MSTISKLKAEVREKSGKGAARAVRREKRVPGIVYGGEEGQVMISSDLKEFTYEFMKGNFQAQLLDLEIGGKTVRVLPREVQLHPVSDIPEHADFLRVNKNTKVNVLVRVHFLNHEECPGLEAGGVLNIVRHEVELLCNASHIPEGIDVDLKGLEIGDSVHISHVKLPNDAKPTITDRDFTIATIVAKTEEVEEEPAAAEGEGAEGAEGAAAEGDAKAEPADKDAE